MNFWTLVIRSLRFHARTHVGTFLGAAVGSAVLIGALVVGDSVRISLRDLALQRLGRSDYALVAGDRFFRSDLAHDLASEWKETVTPLLQVAGTAVAAEGQARANQVQILGVDARFWNLGDNTSAALTFSDPPAEEMVLNRALADQLQVKAGDQVLLRVQKPSLLSRDVPVASAQDLSVALRLKVKAVAGDRQMGRFSLQANQVPPFNAMVPLSLLQKKLDLADKANLLLLAGTSAGTNGSLSQLLSRHWLPADAGLELRSLPSGLELRSPRVFLDPPVVERVQKAFPQVQPVLTYFVNELRHGTHTVPYSMVTAMGAPVVPATLGEEEVILNDWAAESLQVKVGDPVQLRFFVMGEGSRLEEKEATFRVHSVVPLQGPAGDRELMPDFPGLAKAETSHDWDTGFPIDLTRIKDKDEKYWKEHRGTPKAFISLAAGQKLWANRFGKVTALRWPNAGPGANAVLAMLKNEITPAQVGLSFVPVRHQALAASREGQDFGGLFIGFSFFLIVAALLLMALLFQFALEQRAQESGLLLALGFPPGKVRRLLWAEGTLLAALSGVLGVVGGLGYAWAMLRGLTTIWRAAVGTSALTFHATPLAVVIGLFSGLFLSTLTVWLALRSQVRRPARELLNEGANPEAQQATSRPGRIAPALALMGGLGALGLVGHALWRGNTADPGAFFGAGALLLLSGLALTALWLRRLARAEAASHLTLASLGWRGCARRRKRSLATVALLACGSFLIVAVGANKLDANRNSHQRSSGTGGFALIGESTLPIYQDLNTAAGREYFGLNPRDLTNVQVVPMRVRAGDDASCLNLNRAQTPRLLGLRAGALQERGAFELVSVAKGLDRTRGWSLLEEETETDVVPAIGDQASILWALGKKVGDTLPYQDERGNTFRVRLVGAVANSILQGNLLIDEKQFQKRFPGESGHRMFLIDAPSNRVSAVSAALTRALQDSGLELVPAPQRLAAFNAVQNTYLGTFQVLGGLGLLLGSAGLGVVVLRNVLERRGELALLLAVGFRRGGLRRLVLSEHVALLALGLGWGVIAALVAVLPALLSPGAQLPYVSLGLTLGAVLASGLVWTWAATRVALRGELLEALRNQ